MTQRSGRFNLFFRSWPTVAFLYVIVFSIVVFFPGTRLSAQAVNGINGTVMDSSGAVLSGAHVTATNTATGVASSAVTSSEGTFTVVGLITGRLFRRGRRAAF